MQDDDNQRIPTWVPDWFPGSQSAFKAGSTSSARPETPSQVPLASLTRPEQDSSQHGQLGQNPQVPGEDNSNGLLPVPEQTFPHPVDTISHDSSIPNNGNENKAFSTGNVKTVVISPSSDRTVKRELRGSQLFVSTVAKTG